MEILMATEKEVNTAIKLLTDYFTPKDMSKERLEIYRQQLASLGSGTLERAVAKCLTTITWFPKLNELFAIADELPIKAAVGNQLRAQAFELEKKRAQGTFIESEWMTLADSFGRLDKPHARQAVLDRIEARNATE